jgi:hypothetical protein
MLTMHPNTVLWLQEQDRERAMTQRALERAARSGGEQRPGLARGGINGFARVLRRAGSAVASFHLGCPRPTSDLSGRAAI